TGSGSVQPLDVDLHDAGELTPVVAALCTLADGPSRIRGVAHLRGHETDRIAALATEINRLGGTARETDDGLEIEPGVLRPPRRASPADAPSRTRGVAHLRGHETDRLAALATEINRLGGTARETDDGLEIEPGVLRPARLETYADHRMAHFAAVVGLRLKGTE